MWLPVPAPAPPPAPPTEPATCKPPLPQAVLGEGPRVDDRGRGPAPSPHIRLYDGPLPPSRGVHRGPMTSVALQSMQLGAFTTSRSPWRS